MRYHLRWGIMTVIILALAFTSIHVGRRLERVSDLGSYPYIEFSEQVQSLAYDEKESILFLGSYQNRVVALNLSGELLWSFEVGNVVTDIELGSDRSVYVASDDQHIYKLDKRTGQLIDDIDIQRRVYDIDLDEESGSIAISAGTTATKHYLMVYDTAGNQQWKIHIPSTCQVLSYSRDFERIYVGSDRADLITFTRDGKEISRLGLRSAVKGIGVSSQTDDITVITDYGTLYRINQEGKIAFSTMYEFQENVTGFSLDKNGQQVALGGKFGELYVLDQEGAVLFQDDQDHAISSFFFTETDLVVGSLGDPVIIVPLRTFDSSRLASIGSTLMKVVTIILFLFFGFCLILSFQISRDWSVRLWITCKRHRTAYVLLIPTFLMLIIFMYYPMIIAFVRGFTDWNVRSEQINFVGFSNFKKMVTEGYFLLGLKNLFIIALADMVKVLTIPMIVAELVFAMKAARLRYWFRFFFVLPMVVPMIVTILMWKNIYDPSIGMLNNLLSSFGLEQLQRVWLGDPKTALGSIIGMGFPFIDGFAFLVYYGGLINIPSQLFEAAKVDGAGRFWNFTHIHLPLLTPQFKMLIILKFIGSIQNFMPIYILTGGGPGEITYVPGLELYYHATTFGNYGYACALGMAMFVFILIGTIFNMRMRTQSQA